MTRIGQVYKPEDLADVEERKRKGKDVMAEDPQRMKRVSEEESVEFIKTLKRSKYSIVEQLK